MANKSKAEAAAALLAFNIPRVAFTIPQFCARNGDLSEGTYRKMKALRIGPRETHVLDRVIITIEAETEWRHEREAASNPDDK
jgi:hypothetical protein